MQCLYISEGTVKSVTKQQSAVSTQSGNPPLKAGFSSQRQVVSQSYILNVARKKWRSEWTFFKGKAVLPHLYSGTITKKIFSWGCWHW